MVGYLANLLLRSRRLENCLRASFYNLPPSKFFRSSPFREKIRRKPRMEKILQKSSNFRPIFETLKILKMLVRVSKVFWVLFIFIFCDSSFIPDFIQ